MFKPRSKSIGRSPSRSFNPEGGEQLEEHNALNNETVDNPSAVDDSKLERIEILSELTNELDKKQICGDKYTTQDKSQTASYFFLSLNKCKKRVNISPPSNLSNVKRKIWIFN